MRRFVLGMGCALVLTSCGVKNLKSPSASEAAKPAPAPATQPPATPPPAAQPSASQPSAPAPVDAAPAKITTPSFPARFSPENDAEKKMDGSLLQVARAARSGGAQQAEATAKTLSILGDDQRIKIDAALMDKSSVPAFREAVTKLGGEVIVSLENHVFVYVPPAAIEPLAGRGDVYSMATAAATVRQ